ncbi:hypothetical protein BIZ42_06390 [Stenotrophomonas sp. LM091]|uniref:type VI secretion system-associated FHA domain protein TagH n=1 Tax=Stenotrophomonas TaxID=40323 RepID=UPI00089DD969|nr:MULTISPECIES: type VI secretion system-associated FHA domain protein TagH [Stenotrophomonas]AOX61857.1 hypothetical protein BIZ42_06390 [Stenotrophomonas sp. LM091]MCX2920133.1 type VI secretion system-associated FHA domain protein TagH [Stenotrophomonas rhizophila]
MTTHSPAPRLHLVVANPEFLDVGSTPIHVFDAAGGTIGSRGANWVLADSAGRVAPIHAEVAWVDRAYCLVQRGGATWINDAKDPLGPDVIIALNHGEVVRIGPYRINVNLGDDSPTTDDPGRHLGQQSLGEILNTHDAQFERLSTQEPADVEPVQRHDAIEPMAALDAAVRRINAQRKFSTPMDATHYGLSSSAVTQSDLADTNREVISNGTPAHGVDRAMNNAHTSSPATHAEGLHVAMIPFGQGLGIGLGHLDSEQAHRVLHDAGSALRAAIQGLAGLYAQTRREGQGTGLLNRTLQPIEDNPLRLQQGYADTAHALFAGTRSPVHLAPQAAVAESLEQVARHNDASAVAVKAALGALLAAFSPDALTTRFQRYAGGTDAQPDAGWLWEMYGHYFDELMSSRQQGFDRMFWEVFDQAYDRAMRAGG